MKVRASRGVCGHAPPENFGFLEAQISYFQHFEEFSNKKLTLHYSLKIKSIPATMLFCNIFSYQILGRDIFPPVC
jgi:hypothetical protein